MKIALIAALALVCVASSAEARCVESGSVMIPSCNGGNFLAGVNSIRVTMKRERVASKAGKMKLSRRQLHETSSYGTPSPSFAYSIARPARYIAGRLICARNVNAALAERGIQGTGSALAHSFDHWGIRVPIPVVGAVAVTDRRGGGHVAIVSRVEGSRVFAWNPGRHGWQEREYTSRHARYRVAG